MKKFLLNASSGIGDIMFFLPAVLALKETYPDSQIGVMKPLKKQFLVF